MQCGFSLGATPKGKGKGKAWQVIQHQHFGKAVNREPTFIRHFFPIRHGQYALRLSISLGG